MLRFTIIVIYLLFVNTIIVVSQKVILQSDTVLSVQLKEVTVTARAITSKRYYRQTRLYRRTIRNFYIVYPYAHASNIKIKKVNDLLAKEKRKKVRRKIIRKEYKKMLKMYKKPIMKMQISQGKLLMKLIDRETGSSSYFHLKEMKGSAVAFFWQSIARMFGSNLKAKYKPLGEDWMVEEIFYRIDKGEIPPPKKMILE